jgi:two-component system chemotaxis response regulator CheB
VIEPEPADAGRPVRPEVVALAASAGGLAALMQVLTPLPACFPAPVLLVLHLDPNHSSIVAALLDRRTALRVVEAREGDLLEPGVAYVGPPARHLTVGEDRRLRLTDTARVHFVRPAADELFLSVARAYGPAAIGVVCTGTGGDGSKGLAAIRSAGGFTIAQDEATSNHFGMPGAAINAGAVSLVLPLGGIAPKLLELVGAT